MGQAGCREKCAGSIGLTDKECRDCLSDIHQAEFSTDLTAEDHHSDLHVSRAIQLVDVPAESADRQAVLEQQHKDLALWWKQQQEQELAKAIGGGSAKTTGDARDDGRQQSLDCDSQAPLLGPPDAAAQSPPGRDPRSASAPHAGKPPPHERAPPPPPPHGGASAAPPPHGGALAAALSPAGHGAEKSPGGSVPSTDWATKSAHSASRLARVDDDASWCDEEDDMGDLGTERVARRPQSMDSPRTKTASGMPVRKDSRSPGRLPGVSKGERWHSQLDNFTCELTGYRRRPIMVSARKARRLQREQEIEAGLLTAPVPHPQPAVPKREYKPPPPLRKSLLERPALPPPAAAAKADPTPILADPRPQPGASISKPPQTFGAAKPPQSFGAAAGGGAPPWAPWGPKSAAASGGAPAYGSRARDSSGGSSSSSSDPGPTRRPASVPPSLGWTSQYSPAVTGKCRPSSRARPGPAVPSLGSLAPENLRKEATRGRSGAPAPQGAAAAQAKPGGGFAGLSNYFGAAGLGSTQQPATEAPTAVTVSGTTAASQPAPVAKGGDDDDLVVTLDAAVRNLDQAENSVYGKAFNSFGGGGAVALGSKPLREFLLQQTCLQEASLDQELKRAASGGSLTRQGFVQLLREHAAPRDVLEEAFRAAAGGADTVKPVSRCRLALQQAACNQLGAQLPKPKWDKIFQVVLRGVKELDAHKWSEVCSLLFRVVRLAKYAKL